MLRGRVVRCIEEGRDRFDDARRVRRGVDLQQIGGHEKTRDGDMYAATTVLVRGDEPDRSVFGHGQRLRLNQPPPGSGL